ncbi:hypothetical protein JCGZ_22259 [Jatropha curcas]|uniref:Jacalin-type lectin domain-containing protein n=1 Tax=Jatropha curcas TaxID=180498 RepID=A0A067JVW9_JATCU|nr:hypothetical protein JCGZ_22259 [Jatropha curcas]
MSYQVETCKPCGGQDGDVWDDGFHTTIRQLIVGVGSIVESLQVEYDKHGRSMWCERCGYSIGGNKYMEFMDRNPVVGMVKLDYPREYLVSISGHYDSDDNSSYICSLTFKSNRNTYGPFGSTRGIPFSTPSSYGKIIGLHGTAYRYLHSIGVHVKPILPIILGPYGGHYGDPWEDKSYSTLRQIQLTVCEFGIESIRFQFDRNGSSAWSKRHGSKAEGKLEKVILDYPSEFLISVSGTYGEEHNLTMVQSITFQSNKKSYGPFGLNKGNHFSLASAGDQIIGFHGRSGYCLNAIGAYIEPMSYL